MTKEEYKAVTIDVSSLEGDDVEVCCHVMITSRDRAVRSTSHAFAEAVMDLNRIYEQQAYDPDNDKTNWHVVLIKEVVNGDEGVPNVRN